MLLYGSHRKKSRYKKTALQHCAAGRFLSAVPVGLGLPHVDVGKALSGINAHAAPVRHQLSRVGRHLRRRLSPYHNVSRCAVAVLITTAEPKCVRMDSSTITRRGATRMASLPSLQANSRTLKWAERRLFPSFALEYPLISTMGFTPSGSGSMFQKQM